MKRFLFICLVSIGVVSCWNNQWEDRVNSGDTGTVTHGTKNMSGSSVPTTRDLFIQDSTRKVNESGKLLFRANCISCHCDPTTRGCEQSLAGILDRAPSKQWCYDFIHDSQKVIKSGDAYANELFRKYNSSVMLSFPQLTNEQIDTILSFVNSSSDH